MRAPINGTGSTIAWHEHVEAWEAYRKKYGNDQSAERIAERGGFGLFELRMLLGRDPTTVQGDDVCSYCRKPKGSADCQRLHP